MQLNTLLTTLLLALLQVVLEPKVNAPRYQAEDTLAPYVGTWVGHTSTGEFKLVLEERKKYHISDAVSPDIITGRHSYVTQDGPVNESLSLPAGRFVLACFADNKNPGGVYGSFEDRVNRRNVDIKMSFTNTNKTQLSWVISGMREAMSVDPAKPVLPGVSVPSNLVLTKVE